MYVLAYLEVPDQGTRTDTEAVGKARAALLPSVPCHEVCAKDNTNKTLILLCAACRVAPCGTRDTTLCGTEAWGKLGSIQLQKS